MQGITFKANAQLVVSLKITDPIFGNAKGDNNETSSDDNTEAFIKAGYYFSSLNLAPGEWAELIIPSYYPENSNNLATYYVGKQISTLNSYSVTVTDANNNSVTKTFNAGSNVRAGIDDMLYIENTNNSIVIRGGDASNSPIIRYRNNLLFGSFLNPNQLYERYEPNIVLPVYSYTNLSQNIIPLPQEAWQWAVEGDNVKCWIGNFIGISNSQNITIKDLILDGNNSHFIWGGIFSDKGIQLPHSGISCRNATHINIENVISNQFGLDGIVLLTNNYDIKLTDCVFNKNTRCGFGYTGGEKILATNCDFNETGRNNIAVLSNPGAGLDIEPDCDTKDIYGNCISAILCKNGRFINCRFNNNRGCNIVSDKFMANFVEDMYFQECTTHKVEEYGLWCMGKKFEFNKCHIYCSVVNSGKGLNDIDKTMYIECDFEDKPFNGMSWDHNHPLIKIDGNVFKMDRTAFQKCTFKVNDKDREFFYLNWNTNNLLESDYTVIDNCTFTYNNEGHPGENPSLIRGVKFKGSNKIKNIKNGLNSYHLFNTREILIEGSGNPCYPNLFTLEGQVEHLYFGNDNPNSPEISNIGYQSTNADGYLQYIVNDKSLVGVNLGNRLNISSTSAMHFNTNASLYGAGQYECNGGLLMHKGSYLNLAQGGQFINPTNVNSNNLIYIDQKCNQQLSISPIWCNGIGFGTGVSIQPILNGVWQGAFSNGTCVQGAHADIASPLCTTLYSQVVNSGSMNLLYKTDISCFGGANAMISFTVNGGTPNYTITCVDINAGAPLSFNTNYTVSTGMHIFVVKDATNCMQTFVVPVETTLEYNIIKGCVSNTPATITTNACSATIAGPGTANNVINTTWELSAAGTYTITATTAQNATVTKTFYIGDCSNCITAPLDAEWYAPNSFTSTISPSGILLSDNIVLSGSVQIDNEWIVYNKNLHMTNGSSLNITTGNDALVLNNSHVAGCNNHWNGIVASMPDSRVLINNGSVIQDMLWGVNIENNAFIQASNSTYKNNHYGIRIKNNMNPGLESFIVNNTFKGDNMPFYMGVSKPWSGITIDYSGNIEIGKMGDISYGNHFENMSNGIFINQTQPMTVNSVIGIYNNTFKNIKNAAWWDYAKLANCYLSKDGAGIYAQADANINTHSFIKVDKDGSAATYDFEDCDKAIVCVGAGATVLNQRIEECLLGIMCKPIYSRDNTIIGNYIHKTHIGIEVTGRKSNAINNNTIYPTNAITAPGGTKLVSIGIKFAQVGHYSPMGNAIDDNDIYLDKIAGIGITTANTDYHLYVLNNEVQFTTNNTVAATNYNFNSLAGLWAQNNNRATYNENNVIGPQNINVWKDRATMGMFVDQSQNLALKCNSNFYTWYGIFGWGDNKTASKRIRNNRCNANIFPWLLTDYNSSPGASFGHVGDPSAGGEDNGNQFIATTNGVDWRNAKTGVNADEYKVYRWSNLATSDKIFTKSSLLIPDESGASIANNKYGVDLNANSIENICSGGVVLPNYFSAYGVDSNEYNNAMSIVNDSVSYLQYAEVGSWIDKYKLYLTLDQDSVLLNSDPKLQTYYDTIDISNMGNILYAERMLEILYDSTTDGSNYASRYSAAVSANGSINEDVPWELNEKIVNEVWLYLSHGRLDSVDSNLVYAIQNLASSCPFVEGLAVYKARTLWALWEPSAVFDDRGLCAQGQSKNQGNENIDEFMINSLKELTSTKTNRSLETNNAIVKEKQRILTEDSKIKVYPNPASEYILIEYDCENDGVFLLYNSIGQQVLSTQLEKGKMKVQIVIKGISNGMYQYKCTLNGCLERIGKLSVQH